MTVVSVRYFFAIPTAFLAAALLMFELAWIVDDVVQVRKLTTASAFYYNHGSRVSWRHYREVIAANSGSHPARQQPRVGRFNS